MFLLFSCLHLSAEVLYDVTEIKISENADDFLEPRFINDNGQVAGESETGGFLWEQNGKVHLFSPKNAPVSDYGSYPDVYISGLNNEGQIVGTIYILGDSHAYIWDKEKGIQYLMINETTPLHSAISINNLGQVLGTVEDENESLEDQSFYVWQSKKDSFEILFEEDGIHTPIFIDDKEQSFFLIPNLSQLPFPEGSFCIWNDKNSTFNFPAENWLFPTIFNSGGDAGGYMKLAHIDQVKTYFWCWSSEQKKCKFFLPIEDHLDTWITIEAMNNRNEIVGSIAEETPDDSEHESAFIWDEIRGKRNLNDLIDPASHWDLNAAHSINNKGQIIGVGIYKGLEKPFLLTPKNQP